MKNVAAYTPLHENDLNASTTNTVVKRTYYAPTLTALQNESIQSGDQARQAENTGGVWSS